MEYRVTLEGAQLAAQGDPFNPLEEGEEVYVHISPQRCLLVHGDAGINNSVSEIEAASETAGLGASPLERQESEERFMTSSIPENTPSVPLKRLKRPPPE